MAAIGDGVGLGQQRLSARGLDVYQGRNPKRQLVGVLGQRRQRIVIIRERAGCSSNPIE